MQVQNQYKYIFSIEIKKLIDNINYKKSWNLKFNKYLDLASNFS